MAKATLKAKTTLDNAHENYRANPRSEKREQCLMDAAIEYWFDHMIGDEALLAILHELRD